MIARIPEDAEELRKIFQIVEDGARIIVDAYAKFILREPPYDEVKVSLDEGIWAHRWGSRSSSYSEAFFTLPLEYLFDSEWLEKELQKKKEEEEQAKARLQKDKAAAAATRLRLELETYHRLKAKFELREKDGIQP